MARIENHKYSIDEAFRECFYIVPDYQREYVWTEVEVEQLLQDIDEQIDGGSNREYFIGTVLVSPTAHRGHYEVIDGQQRLTTFFLLLCVLKHRLKGEEACETVSGLIRTSYTAASGKTQSRLKLDPQYEGAGELMSRIVALDADPTGVRAGIQAAGISPFGSLEKLIDAYDTIHGYLEKNYPDAATLTTYWGYLANNVVFIQISTELSSALKIFETINERGVGLNPMDLLKNLLFTHVDSNEFAQLKNEWKKITKPLETAKEKPLRFLRYFLMANYVIKNERSDAVVHEDEIYTWFTKKENATLSGYTKTPFDFVRRVIRNVDQYLAFAKGMGNDGNPNVPMDNLRLLTGGAFSLHYVLLLAAASLPKALFDHFVVQLEAFLFFFIFTKTPTKELERNFSVWADELRAIAEVADAGQQRAMLNTFVENRFASNMTAKTQELSDALRRYSMLSMQKYRTRYLLARITQTVDMAFGGIKVAGSLRPLMSLEIEHILPDRPKADLSAAWAIENPGFGYEDFKNRLGNLTLFEKPINIVAGNSYYAQKVGEYGKSAHYLTRSLTGLVTVGNDTSITRINAKLQAFPQWNAASIEARHAMLIELAKDIWKTTPIDG